MSNLLLVTKLQSAALQKKQGIIPLMVEVPIDPQTAPYLVSSTSSLLWIDEPHPGDVVKAAVRQDVAPASLFLEVLESVMLKGNQEGWGNVFPFSLQGILDAIDYVKSFDLDDLEVLVPRVKIKQDDKEGYERPEWLNPTNIKLPLRPTSWLPENCAVVLPKDRELVGVLGHLTNKAVIVVVHNASRCFGIAKGV
jgi:hypothetical protein